MEITWNQIILCLIIFVMLFCKVILEFLTHSSRNELTIYVFIFSFQLLVAYLSLNVRATGFALCMTSVRILTFMVSHFLHHHAYLPVLFWTTCSGLNHSMSSCHIKHEGIFNRAKILLGFSSREKVNVRLLLYVLFIHFSPTV